MVRGIIKDMDRSQLYDLRDYINFNWEKNGLTVDEAQHVMNMVTKEIRDKQIV